MQGLKCMFQIKTANYPGGLHSLLRGACESLSLVGIMVYSASTYVQ